MKWALEAMPDEEQEVAFCVRVADGDSSEAYRLRYLVAFSEVWRTYAHSLAYARQMGS